MALTLLAMAAATAAEHAAELAPTAAESTDASVTPAQIVFDTRHSAKQHATTHNGETLQAKSVSNDQHFAALVPAWR